MLSYALLQYLCTQYENPPCGVKAKLRHASDVYGPNHMSLFFWLASIGSFTQMVNDPEEMRFCAVGTEIFAEAARKRDGAKSDDAQFFDIIGYRYLNRLVELGGADPEASQRLKAQLTGPLAGFFADETATETFSPEVQRFSKCLNLAFGVIENEKIVDTARALDENEAAKANPVAPVANDDVTLIDFNPLEIMAVAGISEARKLELRCAVYAQGYVNAPKNYPRFDGFGLTSDRAAALRDQVSTLIVAESGASRAGIDGLFGMLANEVGDDAEDDIKLCAPLYQSIVSGADGILSVTGLSPAVPVDQPTMPRCYALLIRNAGENVEDRAVDSQREADNQAADKLAEAYLLAHPGKAEQAGAEIAMAMADLDRNAKQGKIDADHDLRLAACRKMADDRQISQPASN
jgi:hypothetical protein